MRKLPTGVLSVILSITAYAIVVRFFPEDVTPTNSQKDLRGDDLLKNPSVKSILNKRAVKVDIFTLFAAYTLEYFNQEIKALLIDDIFTKGCVEDAEPELKIVCDIIKQYELHDHTKTIRALLVADNITNKDKEGYLVKNKT